MSFSRFFYMEMRQLDVQWKHAGGMSLRCVGLLHSMSRFFFGVVAFGNLLRCGTVSLI